MHPSCPAIRRRGVRRSFVSCLLLESAERVCDGSRVRKTSGVAVSPNNTLAVFDFKDAMRAGNQIGVGSKLRLEYSRHTGGMILVASFGAVFDGGDLLVHKNRIPVASSYSRSESDQCRRVECFSFPGLDSAASPTISIGIPVVR